MRWGASNAASVHEIFALIAFVIVRVMELRKQKAET